MRQKTKVDDAQKELLTQLGTFQHQINDFEERRDAIAVSCCTNDTIRIRAERHQQKQVEEAAAARVVAQNSKTHYEKKLADERAKVNQVEETARVLEDEFKV